jgi:hypothetical protein
MFNDDSSFRIGIMPTYALLFGSYGIDGSGGAIQICLWFPRYKSANFYVSIGPGFGRRSGGDERQGGWGMLFNVGTSVLISNKLTLNFEVSGILQNNEYENVSDFILAPSLNLGLIF